MQTTNISKEQLTEIADKLKDSLEEAAGRPMCYALLAIPARQESDAVQHVSKSHIMSNTGKGLPEWLRHAAASLEKDL